MTTVYVSVRVSVPFSLWPCCLQNLPASRNAERSDSAGALLATVGAVTMVYGAAQTRTGSTGLHDSNRGPALGALLLVGNCTAMAAYFVVARRVSAKYSSLCVTVCTACCMLISLCKH